MLLSQISIGMHLKRHCCHRRNHKATEAAYEQTLNNVHENEVVEGEITDITKREVVVRIGSKSDGVIPANEFRYNPELK